MKKILTVIATLLTLTACVKEPVQPSVPDGDGQGYDIFYTVAENAALAIIGGQGTTAHLATDSEWDALLDRFCDNARGGNQVLFCTTRSNATQAKGAVKDTPTSITTSNREELKSWMKEMEKAGKTVIVTFDEGTGNWNGTAYANLSLTDTQVEAQDYSGTIAFTATPVLSEPPLGGVVLSLLTPAADTLVVTVHGMMLWFEDGTTNEVMELLDGSQGTFNGVENTHTDLNGNQFQSLDLVVPDDGIIEF